MNGLYVSRFRLFHNGYLDVVRHILEGSVKRLILAIGAAQLSGNYENPFSGEERQTMIASALKQERLLSRVLIVQLDESGVGYDDWVARVRAICPPFEVVYSHSQLARELFQRAGYQIIEVPSFAREEYSFNLIQRRILDGEPWEDLVPKAVATFIKANRLDVRLAGLNRYGNEKNERISKNSGS